MAFLDALFPPRISLNSSGGPEWRTTVVRLDSGHEQRNQHWSAGLGRWDAGSHIRTSAELDEVLAFFNVAGGMAHTFRLKDPHDYKATSETLGIGDGADATFQLIKTYTFAATTQTRTITLPVSGTVAAITVAGTPKVEGTHYNINYTTGVVTFTGGNIPTGGQAVVAPYCEFHKKVRVETDSLSLSYADLQQGSLSLPLVEVRA